MNNTMHDPSRLNIKTIWEEPGCRDPKAPKILYISCIFSIIFILLPDLQVISYHKIFRRKRGL